MIKKIKELYKLVISFITHDIWHVGTEKLSKRDAWLVRLLKVFILSLRGLSQNKVNQQASSLTLYLLMSIVPIIALAFAVAKGFGIDEQFKSELIQNFSDQEDIIRWILDFADSTIRNARGGWIAGIGMIVLLWTSMNMLVQIENSFNSIWQVKRPRSWSRRFADYISVMLVVPILLFMGSSFTVTIKYYVDAIPFVGDIAPFFYKLIPFVLMWFLFAVLYIVMPNTKVKFSSAFVAGIVAGTVFQFLEQSYFYSQVSISKYNAIYGSLAAIPLFLIWAKLSWQVALFGAELAFAYQNIDNYELEMNSDTVSHHNKRILALYVMQFIAKNVVKANLPMNAQQIAEELHISTRMVRMVTDTLVDCGILVETITSNVKENAYMPSIDVHKISISFVLDRLDNMGKGIITQKPTTDLTRISTILDKLAIDIENSEGSMLLIEI
jgi:membrane protein